MLKFKLAIDNFFYRKKKLVILLSDWDREGKEQMKVLYLYHKVPYSIKN